ncbi:APO protein 3, mitochondrial [Ancistrocladus abbreviatus]
MLSLKQSLRRINCKLIQNLHYSSVGTQTFFSFGEETHDPLYVDVPKPRRRSSERKPYPTPMTVLMKRAKEEKELRKVNPCRMLEHRPDNGLLVPELVDMAHRVYQARESLLSGIAKLIQFMPVLRCRFCFEVYIGHVGHQIRTCNGPKAGFRHAMHAWRKGGVQDVIYFPYCFHIYDRVGKPRVIHKERFNVQRLPAIVELCMQAGVDLVKYPALRRTKPVYCIEGRIVDFESQTTLSGHGDNQEPNNANFLYFTPKVKANDSGENLITSLGQLSSNNAEGLKDMGTRTLELWFEMISGAKKIMEKYTVWTCGYCPEVQVGPKGHKVRMCKASKHQSRDGMHAWQEATIDDLVGPNYVWHVRDPCGPPLNNNLKRYYGKAPAVVELCVQAGAPVPDEYRSMMRLDVVPPDIDEVDLVA